MSKCAAGHELPKRGSCPKCGARSNEPCPEALRIAYEQRDILIRALTEAERFMAYFANETDGHFVGPGTPTTCLAEIRSALAGCAHPPAQRPDVEKTGEGQS